MFAGVVVVVVVGWSVIKVRDEEIPETGENPRNKARQSKAKQSEMK